MSWQYDGTARRRRFYQTGRFALGMGLLLTVLAVVFVVVLVVLPKDDATGFRYLRPASIEDGLWTVPDEAPPGTYDTEGSVACHWQRLRALGDDPALVIEEGGGEGRLFVFIERTDGAFRTSGCGKWERIQY